ncbi:hypothetical protein BC940DRAFT_252094 [Gongronella butleri]|nr:hypothetical protein BC940DRAFT_252094 [Gongronella butleri]
MGAAHSKNVAASSHEKARSRKRSKLFGRPSSKQAKTEGSSHTTRRHQLQQQQQQQQQQQHEPVAAAMTMMPLSPSTPAATAEIKPLPTEPPPQKVAVNPEEKDGEEDDTVLPLATSSRFNIASLGDLIVPVDMDIVDDEEEDEDDEEDKVVPLAMEASQQQQQQNQQQSQQQQQQRRRGRRSRTTSASSTRLLASRPMSTISSMSESGLASGVSTWTSSAGLFSHIDPNTSSTITAITDYSTISRKSMLDWPDDDAGCISTTIASTSTRPPPYSTTTANANASANAESVVHAESPADSPEIDAFPKSDALPIEHVHDVADPEPMEVSACTAAILQELAQAPADAYALFKRVFVDEQEASAANGMMMDAYKAAERWYDQTHDDVALVWMTRCTMEGWGTPRNASLAFNTLQSLADRHIWHAYYPLALCYLHGVAPDVQPPDGHAAANYFKAASTAFTNEDLLRQPAAIQQMISMAQYRLGSMLFHGVGVAEQPDHAVHWFTSSAALGNRYAQFIVGFLYEQGITMPQDHEKAIEYYSKSAHQQFSDAQAALGICLVDKGRVPQGLDWLKKAVHMKNTRAMLKLAILHESGQGVAKNQGLALQYFKMAAQLADPVANYVLGLYHRLGDRGLVQHDALAAKFLLQSARAGFAPAQRVLGLLYAQGVLGSSTTTAVADQSPQVQRRKDEKTAFVWFRRAASHGDVRALGLVGSCYEHGHGVAINLDIALQYYQKAARTASPFQPSAQLAVANLCHRMNRYNDALKWFQLTARIVLPAENTDLDAPPMVPPKDNDENDHHHYAARASARLMIARYLLHGWVASLKNPLLAFDMLQDLATDEANGHAHYWLGACYEEGIVDVCTPDLPKAFYHYRIAARTGDADAQFQVGFMLSNGKGVAKDRQAAFFWYESAGKQGHKTALYSVGLYYVKGLDGTCKNLEKAAFYFEQAAHLGMVLAMTALGNLYRLQLTQQGANASQEQTMLYKEQMIKWYGKAALHNDTNALRELGMIYSQGLFGTPHDHLLALDHLRKASAQNDVQATLLLGSYYEQGTVVTQNPQHALQCYLKVANQGSALGRFAAAQVYHAMHEYELAYEQYGLAAKDAQLARTKVGRTARLMVARYALSYVTAGTTDNATHVHTKEDAFDMLERLAVVDRFAPSFYWLADCYYTGSGTEQNYDDALHWFHRSANEAHAADASFKLALMHELGHGTDINLTEAIRYYQAAANKNHVESLHRLGMAYWRGQLGLTADAEQAIQWFTKSATERYGESHWALGQMAFEHQDHEMALAWWQKAMDVGHVVSMRCMATLLLPPQGGATSCDTTAGDLSKALQLLVDASRLGDAESLVLLGQIHQAGLVTALALLTDPQLVQHHASPQQQEPQAEIDQESAPSSPVDSILNSDGEAEPLVDDREALLLQRQQEEQELAVKCFEQAAHMGHVQAMFLAGQEWHQQQQYAAAYDYYHQAAQHDHLLAQVMCARYQLAGLGGIPMDKTAGFTTLLACAEQRDCAEAFNSLAQCYEMGWGTSASAAKAYDWYRQAATANKDTEAMYRIGLLHVNGHLGPEASETSELSALDWFQMAVEISHSTHAGAMYQLALLLLPLEDNDNEHDESATRAKHYLVLAAHHGSAPAMARLGLLGLQEHDTQAIAWLTQAAHAGSSQAQCTLGLLYHAGMEELAIAQDFERAFDFFCQAAQHGDVTACLYLGTYYEHGIQVTPCNQKAKDWYRQAMDHANELKDDNNAWIAQLAYARLLHQEQPSKDAFQWLCNARENATKTTRSSPSSPSSSLALPSTLETDDVDAAMALCNLTIARYQLYGWADVPCNHVAAANTLLALAEQGHRKTYVEIAQCFESGTGVPKNTIAAYTWYGHMVAAANATQNTHQDDDDDLWDDDDQKNYARALFKLAEFYRLGLAPDAQNDPDLDKAQALYAMAAQNGSLDAKQHLF